MSHTSSRFQNRNPITWARENRILVNPCSKLSDSGVSSCGSALTWDFWLAGRTKLGSPHTDRKPLIRAFEWAIARSVELTWVQVKVRRVCLTQRTLKIKKTSFSRVTVNFWHRPTTNSCMPWSCPPFHVWLQSAFLANPLCPRGIPAEGWKWRNRVKPTWRKKCHGWSKWCSDLNSTHETTPACKKSAHVEILKKILTIAQILTKIDESQFWLERSPIDRAQKVVHMTWTWNLAQCLREPTKIRSEVCGSFSVLTVEINFPLTMFE